MDQENAALVRRLMEEVWALGRFQVLPDLISPEYVAHLPIGDHYGPEGVRIEIAAYREAMPDLRVVLDELLTVGDTVVRRFTLRGTPREPTCGGTATWLPRAFGIGVDRVSGGKLVESWVVIACDRGKREFGAERGYGVTGGAVS